MLSILIPIYNYNVCDLTSELHRQCVDANIKFEILLIDDMSTEYFKKQNKDLNTLKGVRLLELDQNIGRSKIRNKLAQEAHGKSFLFLDCDSKIVRSDFVKHYIPYIDKGLVVFGGRIYQSETPESSFYLHWLYGTHKESQPAHNRENFPYKSFMTNNFFIDRNIFEQIKFNEDIRRYGHEDTYFGYQLKVYGIEITHIDNPIEHAGLEANMEFIRKTQLGIQNLTTIMRLQKLDRAFFDDIKLLRYYKTCERFLLHHPISWFFSSTRNLLIKNLCGKKPILGLFDVFKLGFLSSIMVKNGKTSV